MPRSRGSSSNAEVFFVVKATDSDHVPKKGVIYEGQLKKRGGSHGGSANWKSRWCTLAGGALYYAEDKTAKHAKGYIDLPGLSVRNAQAQTGCDHALCLVWPENPELAFYLQASSHESQAEWMYHLNEAVKVTTQSVQLLTTAQLGQRCVQCGGKTASAAHSAMGVEIGRPTTADQRVELSRLLIEHCALRDHATVETPRPDAQPPSMKDCGRGRSLLDGIRNLVSKEKQRFQQDGFDLDLTYITPRVIAMGFPSSGIEGAYRNPIEEVQRFFGKFHADKRWRTYNLCEERVYEGQTLGGDEHPDCCRHFPFDDHNPCCLGMIAPFCRDVAGWLGADADNVAAVHCKAGKGRTGLMVACLLLYLRLAATADEALTFFAEKRTHDGKGVTIPSQVRYVRYFEACLAAAAAAAPGVPMGELSLTVEAPVVRLRSIRIRAAPCFDLTGGCDPYCLIKAVQLVPRAAFGEREGAHARILGCTRVTQRASKVWDSRDHGETVHVDTGAPHVITFGSDEAPLLLRGDVKVRLVDYDRFNQDDLMMQFWCHTLFLRQAPFTVLERLEIDKACKKDAKKNFPKGFALEVETSPYNGADAEEVIEGSFSRKQGQATELEEEPHDNDLSDEDERRVSGAWSEREAHVQQNCV